MNLPAPAHKQEHFLISNDGISQLVNGAFAFGGLALLAKHPYSAFILAGFWLFVAWPVSNWRNSGYAPGLSTILNFLLAMTYVSVLCTRTFDYTDQPRQMWMLVVFSTFFAAQCLLSIILTIPPLPKLLPMQNMLKRQIAQLRPQINIVYGCITLLVLLNNQWRFFAGHFILLWLLFTTTSLRLRPDQNLRRAFNKLTDVLSIWLVLSLICAFFFYRGTSSLLYGLGDMFIAATTAATLATVFNGILTLIKPKLLSLSASKEPF